jgi:ABC-2 type transport system ATP-binding protein
LLVPISAGGGVLPRAIRSLDEANCQVIDVELRRPSLDDVFLTLTGRTAASDEDGQGRT